MKKFFCLLQFFLLHTFGFSQSAPPPIGKLIDINGYKLHIEMAGKGSPTVVLIAGSQAFSFDWALVLPEISKVTSVCAYDRPALAWSDPGPMPRSLDQDVYELHELLLKANLKAPFILVGHSVGGIIARKFEKKYPDEVKGIVLVDATSEDALLFINNRVQRLRLLSQHKAIPPIKLHLDSFTKVPSQKEMEDFLKMVGKPTIAPPFDRLPKQEQDDRIWAMVQPKILIADNGEFWAEEFEAMYEDSTYTLGDKPLFVLSSGKNGYPESLGDSLRNEMMNQRIRQQKRMVALSRNSKQIITVNSGHEIHLSEPNLVINAIKEVIFAVRTGQKMNPA